MGYEAECTIRYDGRTSRGKAALETRELVFRGDARVVIPLKEVTSIEAKGGWLTIGFGRQTAEFKLDAAAEKWARRIANPPSRLQKLGIKAAMVVLAVDVADEDFLKEVRAAGATVARAGGRPSPRTADILLYGASHRRQLGRLEALSALIKPAGALWVIRPKGHPDISEAEVMAAGKRAGLVDVKVASFSETHTAEKFVIPVAKR